MARLPAGITGSCVIVADRCSDRTADRARRWHGGSTSPTIVETTRGCVGAARAAGVRHVLASVPCRPEHVWIANTDADTVLPADWLLGQLLLAEGGADAVAGIVELDASADPYLLAQFAANYHLDPDGTHQHVHGANLGVRGDAYLAVGGWRDLTTAEDHDLWRRLRQRHVCVSSSSIVVHTSARLAGRAPLGFADDLRAHAQRRTVA